MSQTHDDQANQAMPITHAPAENVGGSVAVWHALDLVTDCAVGSGVSPVVFDEAIAGEHPNGLLVLQGQLDHQRLAEVWSDVLLKAQTYAGKKLVIDGAGLQECQTAVVAFLCAIEHVVAQGGGKVFYCGFSDDVMGLIRLAGQGNQQEGTQQASKPASQQANLQDEQAAQPRGFVREVGRATVDICQEAVSIVAFIGELMGTLVWFVLNPTKLRYKDMWMVAEKAGVNAVPVVSLLGFLMGLIIAFQSAIPLKKLGVESMIPVMVGVAMVRELGPLMTAILLAGRTGSAFAAEIGTMHVTEEVNALKTFGLDPTRFLVLPRVIATVLMTPLLSLFATLMGIVGGYVVMAPLGYSLSFYVDQVLLGIDYIDFLQGVVKAGIFALLVAATGCLQGLHTKNGPSAVGDSTTRAVVVSIVLIVICDGVLGVVFYYAGI